MPVARTLGPYARRIDGGDIGGVRYRACLEDDPCDLPGTRARHGIGDIMRDFRSDHVRKLGERILPIGVSQELVDIFRRKRDGAPLVDTIIATCGWMLPGK